MNGEEECTGCFKKYSNAKVPRRPSLPEFCNLGAKAPGYF